MRLIAARDSRRAFEVRDLLERNLLPVRWYDADTDAESAAMLEWLDIPRSETPVLVHATKDILDSWGEDGWELVQIVPGMNPENLVAYLKRPKQ